MAELSKELISQLEKNIYRIFRFSLVFEDFTDNTGYDSLFLDQLYEKIYYFRKEKDNLTEEEQLKLTTDILNDCEKMVDIAGRDKFIFYEDGDINYIWDYSLIKKKGTIIYEE